MHPNACREVETETIFCNKEKNEKIIDLGAAAGTREPADPLGVLPFPGPLAAGGTRRHDSEALVDASDFGGVRGLGAGAAVHVGGPGGTGVVVGGGGVVVGGGGARGRGNLPFPFPFTSLRNISHTALSCSGLRSAMVEERFHSAL